MNYNKPDCILLSESNFTLAYDLKNALNKYKYNLTLCKTIPEMFKAYNGNTRAIFYEQQSGLLDEEYTMLEEETKNILYLVNNNMIYSSKGEPICELNSFICHKLKECKDNNTKKIKSEDVSRILVNMGINMFTWHSLFLKESLIYMLENNLHNATPEVYKIAAAKLDVHVININACLKKYFLKNKTLLQKSLNISDQNFKVKNIIGALYNKVLEEC